MKAFLLNLINTYYPTYIDISNLFGISILRKKLDGPFEEIRINEFVDGIYFINLISNGKKYYSKKIVKNWSKIINLY
ncbi:MAG: T9SS type A sorting domain-containing protein [Saprospiraceae bacterium]|nr:T9SS type A sorting domain-containing protein [Candidatus Defluviibacterium haderslevense]